MRSHRCLFAAWLCGVFLCAPASAQPPLSAPPSPALLKELRATLDAVKPDSVDAKFERVEIAVRIIHVDLALGGTTYRSIGIEPKQAREALEALQQPFLPSLNDLSKAHNRRIFWDAISASNMLYRYFVEGVRLAGHDNDSEFLEANLTQFRDHWAKARSKTTDDSKHLVEEWMRGVLVNTLRFRAISTPAEAAQLGMILDIVPESTTKRIRLAGDPPTTTGPLISLLAGNKMAAFDRAAHQAAGLQRAGHETTFWCVAAPRDLDDASKTVAYEPLILVKDDKGCLVLGGDDVLSGIPSAKKSSGVWRVDAKPLAQFLQQRGLYRVDMKNVLDASLRPLDWSKAMQQALEPKKGSPPEFGSLLETVVKRQWSDFTTEAVASLAITPQAAFLHIVRENSIQCLVTPVKEGKRLENIRIDDVDKRPSEHIFVKHEATLGRAFMMMPTKVLSGLRSLVLQEGPHKEKKMIGVRHGDKLILKEIDTFWYGMGWNSRVMVAIPHFPTAVHELTHCWALSRHGQVAVGEWKGTVIDLFNDIAWERNADKKLQVRDELNVLVNFLREYAATDEKEDLAVAAEYYVAFPKYVRDNVRRELGKGNFVPAVKYLYLKHIAFLDKDGKTMEYEADAGDAPFTMDEFRKGIRAEIERTSSTLTAEQKRLQTIARRILDASEGMIRLKLISRLDRPNAVVFV